MKCLKMTSLAALAAALVASPAMAQSEDKPFDGVYIGGSIGIPAQSSDGREGVTFDTNRDGSFGDSVRTSLGADAFSPGFCGGAAYGRTPGEGCRNDKDGIEYAVRVGADMQQGKFVYGVVLEAGKSQARDSVTAYSTTPAFYTLTRKIDYQGGARLRAGYAPGNILFYATGGLAYAKLKNSFSTSNTANSFSDNGKTNGWGWSAGGGTEVKLAKNFSIGAEYLYSRLKDNDYTVGVNPGTAPATNPFLLVNAAGTDMRRTDPRFDMHNIRLTAAIRF